MSLPNKLNLPYKTVYNFWKKVKPPVNIDDCWVWQGCTNEHGYGLYGVNYDIIKAHRFSYMCYKGIIPKGKHICHKCDNPSCVNINHLFIDDHQGNMKDMVQKGRNAKCEKVPQSKLTESDVKEILQGIKSGRYNNITSIISKHDVSENTIYRILRRERWKHLTQDYTDVELSNLRKKILGKCSNKLTEDVVKQIKQDLRNNIPRKIIAKNANTTAVTICDIATGKTWKHVKI